MITLEKVAICETCERMPKFGESGYYCIAIKNWCDRFLGLPTPADHICGTCEHIGKKNINSYDYHIVCKQGGLPIRSGSQICHHNPDRWEQRKTACNTCEHLCKVGNNTWECRCEGNAGFGGVLATLESPELLSCMFYKPK